MPNTDNLTARQAMLALSALPRLGPVTVRRLLAAFDNDPVAVLRAPASRLVQVERVGNELAQVVANWKSHVDPLAMETRLERFGVEFIALNEVGYPAPLRHIYDPPIGLYCKGPLRPGVKSVAIVGSRRTTLYGQSTAQMLGRELASLGFCVVSGLARGIDTAAHKGALAAGGDTVAVLGNGVDIVYPPENIDLYQQIVASGVVMSELPLGTRASRTTFPMRNRLISGLCAAVIVVETDKQGGSMITARFAAEHNRLLFAVPGRIDSSTSQGCNQLIRDGAILLSSVDDLIEELAYGGANRGHMAAASGEEEYGESLWLDDEEGDSSKGISLFVEDAAGTQADHPQAETTTRHGQPVRTTAGHGQSVKTTAGQTAKIAAGDRQPAQAGTGRGQAEVAGNEAAVLAVLREHNRLDRDALARLCNLPVAAVSASLMLLELRKYAVKRADGTFEAHR